MINKVFSLILAFVLLAGVIPFSAIDTNAITLTEALYVGGVGMADGTYLANGATATTKTKPSVGYAYYKSGVLTLHNYKYSGRGLYCDETHNAYAMVLAATNITIVLEGTNKLSYNGTDVVYGIVGDVAIIFAESAGSLTIDGAYYSIVAEGCVNIGGGSITIKNSTHCIYAGHDITISNSTVNITTDNSGMYAWENITIDKSSTVTIVSTDTGIQAIKNATVSGNVSVTSSLYGVYSNEGNVTVGGTVSLDCVYGIGADKGDVVIKCNTLNITNASYGIIAFEGNVTTYEGDVTVNAKSFGINASKNVTVYNGYLNVMSKCFGIGSDSGNVIVNGGKLSVKSTNTSNDSVYKAIKANALSVNASLRILASEATNGSLEEYSASKLDVYDRIEVDAAESSVLMGDVNGDGFTDNVDAAVVLRYDACITDLTEQQLLKGDVNGDNSVDNIDAALILKYDAGLIDSFGA